MLRRPGMPVDKKATHEVELEPRAVAAFILNFVMLKFGPQMLVTKDDRYSYI